MAKLKKFIKIVFKKFLVFKLLKWMIRENLNASILNAFFITIVAVFLSLYSSTINSSSQNFVEVLLSLKWFSRSIDGPVFGYWIMQFFSIFWVVLFLYSQSQIEQQKVKDNTRFILNATNQIQAAIHTAPNPVVFVSSLVASFTLDDMLKKLQAKIVKGRATKKDYEETILSFLTAILKITQNFNTMVDATYCVNIMPYMKGKDNVLSISTMVAKGEILLFEEADLDNYFIRGLLMGRKDLRLEEGREKNPSPIVNLPIFRKKDKLGNIYLLPGACHAISQHENVVQSTDSTRKNSDYTSSIPPEFGGRLQTFFDGPGSQIKSVVSFVIPHPDYALIRNLHLDISDDMSTRILGVLNIDCSKEFILGTEKSYHKTFYSIIWPIIFKLAPYLQEYLTPPKANGNSAKIRRNK